MTTEPSPAQPPKAPDSPAPAEHHYQHDPDQTMLEKVLNSWLQKIEPYSNQILLGFIGFTIAAVAIIFWTRTTHSANAAGWQQFVAAKEADDFKKIADTYPGTGLSAWARLQQGRRHLKDGLQDVMRNRKASDEHLNEAREAFDGILRSGVSVPAEVREEALLGMAMTLESLSDGEMDAAIKAYEELITAFPDSKHRLWAERRIETLKRPSTSEFYAWFRAQNIAPPDRPLPQDFGASGGGGDDSGFRLPELPLSTGSPAASESPAEGAATSSPSADAAPPSGANGSPPATDATDPVPPPSSEPSEATSSPPAADTPAAEPSGSPEPEATETTPTTP